MSSITITWCLQLLQSWSSCPSRSVTSRSASPVGSCSVADAELQQHQIPHQSERSNCRNPPAGCWTGWSVDSFAKIRFWKMVMSPWPLVIGMSSLRIPSGMCSTELTNITSYYIIHLNVMCVGHFNCFLFSPQFVHLWSDLYTAYNIYIYIIMIRVSNMWVYWDNYLCIKHEMRSLLFFKHSSITHAIFFIKFGFCVVQLCLKVRLGFGQSSSGAV